MITEVCRFCKGSSPKTLGVNPVTKEAITVFMDSFGHAHVVQTLLLSKNANHAVDRAAAVSMLQQNEDTFVAELKAQLKYGNTQIESLKAVLQLCSCR